MNVFLAPNYHSCDCNHSRYDMHLRSIAGERSAMQTFGNGQDGMYEPADELGNLEK